MPVVPGPEAPSITESDLTLLRSMVADPVGADQKFSDDDYATILLAKGSLNLTAAYFWGIKASDFAELVDISEAGSSRSMNQLYKSALDMQKFYEGQGTEVSPLPDRGRTRLRRITREKIDTL